MFNLRSQPAPAYRTIEPTLRERFTDGEIASMARLGSVTHFASGQHLMCEGTVGTHAFFIVEGTAAVSKGDDVVAMVGPGDLVGERALVTNEDRNATVTALAQVTVLQFDVREFAWLRLESQKVKSLSNELALARC